MAAKIATYKKGAFCQLQFPNGERILISLSSSGVKIMKVILAGIIPVGTIHEWKGRPQVEASFKLFEEDFRDTNDSLDAMVKYFSRCNSIAEVKKACQG